MDDHRVNSKINSTTVANRGDRHRHRQLAILHIVMVLVSCTAVLLPMVHSTQTPTPADGHLTISSHGTNNSLSSTPSMVQMISSVQSDADVHPRIFSLPSTPSSSSPIFTNPPVYTLNFDVTPSPTVHDPDDLQSVEATSASTLLDVDLHDILSSSTFQVAMQTESYFGQELMSSSGPNMDYSSSLGEEVSSDPLVVGAAHVFKDRDAFFDIMPSSSDDALTQSTVVELDGPVESVQSTRLMTASTATVSSSSDMLVSSLRPSFDVSPLVSTSRTVIYRQGKQQALDRKVDDVGLIDMTTTTTYIEDVFMGGKDDGRRRPAMDHAVFTAAPALLAMTSDPAQASNERIARDDSRLAAATIAGIALAGVGFAVLVAAGLSVAIVRRLRRPFTIKSFEKQFSNDNCGYLDSLQVSYINSQTDILQESSDEMYSLDNDSFLNSLEAVTMVDNWVAEDRRSCTRV